MTNQNADIIIIRLDDVRSSLGRRISLGQSKLVMSSPLYNF